MSYEVLLLFYFQIDGGYRMPPPAGCPKEVYNVMQQCWMYEPDERPNFTQVLSMLKALEGTVIYI